MLALSIEHGEQSPLPKRQADRAPHGRPFPDGTHCEFYTKPPARGAAAVGTAART